MLGCQSDEDAAVNGQIRSQAKVKQSQRSAEEENAPDSIRQTLIEQGKVDQAICQLILLIDPLMRVRCVKPLQSQQQGEFQ